MRRAEGPARVNPGREVSFASVCRVFPPATLRIAAGFPAKQRLVLFTRAWVPCRVRRFHASFRTHSPHASASVVEVLRSFFTSVFSRPHPPTNTCCCGTCGTYGHRCRCFILVFCFWCARMRAWCSARPAQWHAHAPPIPLCTHARTFFCRHHRFAVVLPAHVAGGRPARLKSPA